MAETPKQEIKIYFPKELAGGAYANNILIQHSKEEFIMDFIMLVPPTGTVGARVVTCPAHAKRIAAALQENIEKYEKTHGAIHVEERAKTPVDLNLYTKQ